MSPEKFMLERIKIKFIHEYVLMQAHILHTFNSLLIMRENLIIFTVNEIKWQFLFHFTSPPTIPYAHVVHNWNTRRRKFMIVHDINQMDFSINKFPVTFFGQNFTIICVNMNRRRPIKSHNFSPLKSFKWEFMRMKLNDLFFDRSFVL